MKLNVKIFTRIINMLLGKKIPEDKFDFRSLTDTGVYDIEGCGCTIFHAKKLGVLKCGADFYCEKIGVPNHATGSMDYALLFGSDRSSREFVFDTNVPTKQEVAQVMEDYLIAVEAGMVEGVEA